MADNDQLFGGRAIIVQKPGSQNIRIENNRFEHMFMRKGQGAIGIRGAQNIEILGNRMRQISLGSGMRISASKEVKVVGNQITQIGRTGIMLLNVQNAQVKNNIIQDVKGVHGNGISAYLASSNIQFLENTVLDAKQPITFNGTKEQIAQGELNNYEFHKNILVATNGALGSLIGWGENSSGVKITQNILLGGRFGLRMKNTNRYFTIEQNFGVKPALFQGEPSGWKVSDNYWFDGPYPKKTKDLVSLIKNGILSDNVPQNIDCNRVLNSKFNGGIGSTLICNSEN